MTAHPTSAPAVAAHTFQVSLHEIWRAVLSWRIWGIAAVDDIAGRYRRTILGPLWITLGQAGFVAGLYLLRERFAANNPHYLTYLAASLPTWGLLASFVVDGSNSLVKAKGYIDAYPIPMAIHSVRSVAASYVNYAHLLVVYVVVAAYEGTMAAALVGLAPGLLITMVFGVGAALLLGPLGARFRDLGPASAMGAGLMFVLTPVFWVPDSQQVDSPLVMYNPFYYLLEVVRAPLIGEAVAPHVWLTASLIALVTLAAGLIVYARMRPQVVYWL